MLGKTEEGGQGENRRQDSWQHHQLNGHEFEKTLGESEGQGSLECCSPRGRKELDMTERMNKNFKLAPKRTSPQCNNGLEIKFRVSF